MSHPEAVNTLMRMADLLAPNAIRVAATLELVDHIDDGADTAPVLAERTRTDPVMLGKLLRVLAELRLLERSQGEDLDHDRYRVAELGAPLRRAHPYSVGRYLSSTGLFGRAELGLVGLLETIRSGVPAYRAAFGREYWEDVNNDPAFADALRVEGARDIGWDAEVIIDSYDWSSVGSVTDVGGNNGTLLIALLRAHPHLRGTVLDLPGNARLAEGKLQAAGLTDRARAVAGSFFDPLPGGSDVYLLSGILGDWRDEDAVLILGRCAEAAVATGPGGRVLLADIKLEVPVGDLTSATLDLSLASTVPAPLRTPAQLAALAERAGLAVSWTGPETPLRSLLELRAAHVPGQRNSIEGDGSVVAV
ncbi:hypothetical protein GCM10023321_77330 [Pseudonocardia eucalypti]|uniref:O-methyltransferase n=1 Tax=Pseudonocardia eucalypti TaxID=648755 RepID=A0ABP9RAM7_9PSEU|nr:hypothetical protein [Pseudonocardia eucalypti]